MLKFVATKKPMRAVLIVAALAAMGCGSASAKSLRDEAPASGTGETARDAAVHDCSVEASKWSMNNWQSTPNVVFGECMTDRGQPQ
jgi:predicted outer membrane protein